MRELIRHIIREQTKEIGEMKKLTTPDFIERAKEVHGDKYDYSEVDYKNNSAPIKIICPIHGEFVIRPNNHLRGGGCQKCSGKYRPTTNDFITDAKNTHGDKYNYSKVKYVNGKTDVEIICPLHGSFFQIPNNHLTGSGCPKCSKKHQPNNKEFTDAAKHIHGNEYDYSEVEYVNSKTPVIIKCPIHGNFEQSPSKHLMGQGCPECANELKGESQRLTADEFIKVSKEVHGDKYDYSKVKYKNNQTPVTIVCPIHGEFTQTPLSHTSGKSGCPRCQESKGEKLVKRILEKHKIKSLNQYKFIDCTNNLQGRYCRKLPFDFYLPDYNSCLEFDGRQHFQPVDIFGGIDSFEKQKKLDKIKAQYCKDNGIKLIRIPYTMKKEDIEPYILSELGM